MFPIGDDSSGPKPAIASLTLMTLYGAGFLWQHVATSGNLLVPLSLMFIPGVLFGGAELPAGVPVFPPPATLVTYMFLHGGWLHLIGNLLFLWVFGPKVEETLGPGRFTMLVILCGIVAALTHAWSNPADGVPMLGASGGISGVLGAYLIFHPRAEVRVIVPVGFVMRMVYLPAFVVLAAWFALQLLYATWLEGAGGIAFDAHVGGFVAGLLLAPLMAPHVVASKLGFVRLRP